MADTIKPDLMKSIMNTPSWTVATKLSEQLMKPDELFVQPKPAPRPALVVPVDVQALYVPVNHSERYVKLPFNFGTQTDKTPVDPFETPVRRPSGIHLHWALPDGLLKGEMAEEGDMPVDLPPLPDRWMISRLVGLRGRVIMSRKNWIIDAGSGWIYEIDKFPENPMEKLPDALEAGALHGLAGGSPAWTASYDASFGRFAFHDNLDGLDPGDVQTKMATYVVIGWWSNALFDPLREVYTSTAAGRELEKFGWSASPAPIVVDESLTLHSRFDDFRVPEKTTHLVDMVSELKGGVSSAALRGSFESYKFDRVVLPQRAQVYETVMQGVVYGVPVTGGIGKDAAPRASEVGLSLAPSLERLIAAQAARAKGITDKRKREYFESLMTSVANGAIMHLNNHDGIVLLDEMEHGGEFEGLQGPDQLVDVLVDRPESELRGRKMRSKAAPTKGQTVKSDVIWSGKKRGQTQASLDSLRRRAQDEVDRKYGKIAPDNIRVRQVRRPGPRYHRPKPPVIGLRNFGKSNRWLGDGRFSEDGRLICQWSREISPAYGEVFQGSRYVPATGSEHVPDVADPIVWYHYCRDPYALPWTQHAVDLSMDGELAGPVKNRLVGEIALRYDADGIYDGAVPIARSAGDTGSLQVARVSEEMRRFSIMEGREVSPVAVTSWIQPWCPVWLEWEVEVEPGAALDGWMLGQIDFEGDGSSEGATHVLRGRSPITTGLGRSYKGAIDTYLVAEAQRDEAGQGEIGEGHQNALADLSHFLTKADLGSVTLDLLSDFWLALPTGPDGEISDKAIEMDSDLAALGLPRLIASGKLRLTRARVIDTFGRYRDVPTDRVTLPAALESKTEGGDPALALAPRLSLPGRLMWRFVDPADDGPHPEDASLDQNNKAKMINPVAGYILPDFMDESLEFFDQDGKPLGEVLHDPLTGGVAWEGAVGQEGRASNAPLDRMPDTARACGHLAQGMIDADLLQRNNPLTADKESPLSAFLRAVDTTMWSVDSDLTSAGATIAGLVGKPVAVVSSTLWLDIPQDLSLTGVYDTDEIAHIEAHLINQGVFEAVKSHAFQVRLGELAKGHDGLYGYYINDDYSNFHLIGKDVGSVSSGPVSALRHRQIFGVQAPAPLNVPDLLDAPYINAAETLSLHSGQRIRLTLLMEPSARVHATTGFLPRKGLELIREWVTSGLSRVAPSARVGPVLIDPDKVRLPRVAGFGDNQMWTRRDSPLTWRDDPILAATQAAVLPTGRVTVEEGYIRIAPDESGGTN